MNITNARRALLSATALAALCLLAGTASAQSAWPNRVVKIVVPYGPGGAVDVVTRKMAQKLTEQTGQSFIVENKPGATGTIGAQQVAQAPADGYTLLANDTTYSLLPHIFKKLPFEHATQLVPVSAYVFAPMGLVVNASAKYKTLAELTAQAKAAPNTVTYGTGGPGTTPHFASEALGIASGVNFMHIPYKGAGEATAGILSQTIDFQIASTTGLMGNVKGGKLRMLAVSGDKRLAALPEVPTFQEAGAKWRGVVNWTGLWAPQGTPAEVVQRLQKEIATAMASEDMKTFAVGMGAEPRHAGADEFARLLKDSTDSWGKVVANTAFEKQ
ncbi:MAG: tripartite tricarboxylate transporter substrate binding protein [Hydrogenophaga sp.]|uniref:Bug family tripartite tricarboxylate transporter substrate binding protein n=1 Tax=Hydrogenophaga sp. TaxID=1904254 RepID=UPI0025C0E179|nr:tripartite tricarboxylate transporter substrate binding protein [Hydrogenophaga sp.]MBT9554134.1 tripartite tricarboxylate transporter substrate binding protein [Hydrogenophaga sp.]